ncbi:MAG: hypothetical protein ACLFUU_09050 [Desulfobacteraceae bacterium]
MVKTMVFLVVAYALQAVIRFPRGAPSQSRRRGGARFLLYGFATLGLLASGGLVWLVIYVSQVTTPGPFSGPNPALSQALSNPQISNFNEAAMGPKLLHINNPGPGIQPPFALLHPGSPDLGNSSEDEWGFNRRSSRFRK